MDWKSRLAYAEASACTGDIVMARDFICEKGIVKQYTSVKNVSEILKLCVQGASLYEMCRSEEGIRVYFDVDEKRTAQSQDDDLATLRLTLLQLKSFLREMNVKVKRKDFRILSACTESKLSFHLVLPNVIFKNETSRRVFGRKLTGCASKIVDSSPYSRNCLLRCPLSTKLGKNNALIPVDQDLRPLNLTCLYEYIVHRDNLDDCQVVDLQDKELSSMHVPCDTTPAFIIQKLREHGDCLSKYRGFRADPVPSFYFDTVGTRHCLSGSGRVHKSNNFVIIAVEGVLMYHCLSPSCTNHKKYIGETTHKLVQAKKVKSDITYSEPYCRPYEIHKNGSLQVIQSEMGSGKTFQIRKLLQDNHSMSVLIVCFRVELGQYMYDYMQNMDFTMYNKVEGWLKQRRLICQVNSLHRIHAVHYDILILDEIESVIAQFSGVSATKKRVCFLTLEKLIRDTPHVYALDAAVGERSLTVLSSIRPLIHITNTFKTLGNMRMIETNMPSWITNIFETIANGEPIAITSTNARWLVGMETAINRLYPDKKVLLIWSESTEIQKKTFYKQLDQVDIFMYSATLQAGISIEIVHFSRLFVFATAMGPTPAALHQMLARIRKFTKNEIIITFDRVSQMSADEEVWGYDQMVEHVSSSVRIALDSRFKNDMGAVITGFAKDWSRVYNDTPFFTVTVYNILESFNGERHYRKLFMKQALQKGYQITTSSEVWEKNLGEEARQMLTLARNELKLQRFEYYKAICLAECELENPQEHAKNKIRAAREIADHKSNDAYTAGINLMNLTSSETPDLSAIAEATEIKNKAEKDAALAEQDARCAQKYTDCVLQKIVLAKWYGVQTTVIDEDWLRRCEPQGSRDAYFRLCLTVPCNLEYTKESIQARITEVMRHEGRVLTTNGVLFAVDHMQTFTNGIRLALCHQILNDLGFCHIFDTRSIKLNYSAIIESIEPHLNNIASCVELKSVPHVTDLKSLVSFVNKILSRIYKARISKSKDIFRLKHFGFPPVRFVKSCKPFVDMDIVARANLRI